MRDCFDEPLDHIALVEYRELNGDARPFLDLGGTGEHSLHRQIVVDQPVAVQTINCQDKEHNEVGIIIARSKAFA